MNAFVLAFSLGDIQDTYGHAPIMVERFLPADDPVLEDVLSWTVERDARDMARLLEWLPEARSVREQRVLMNRVMALAEELESAMEKMAALQQG